jgi:hypothetical protein
MGEYRDGESLPLPAPQSPWNDAYMLMYRRYTCSFGRHMPNISFVSSFTALMQQMNRVDRSRPIPNIDIVPKWLCDEITGDNASWAVRKKEYERQKNILHIAVHHNVKGMDHDLTH